MTKLQTDQLIEDVGIIKRALIKTEFGPGLLQEHAETKARTYENQRSIVRFRTIVYAISTAVTFIIIGAGFVVNWVKIFG